MRFLSIIFPALTIMVLSSCNQAPLTEHPNQLYNPSSKLALIDAEIKFWEGKIEQDGMNTSYSSKLASAYSAHFGATAEIASLKKAEQLFKENIENAPDNCNALRALAQNYVSQHRFLEAKELLVKATEIGGDLRYTRLLMYDVCEELAEDEEAEKLLNELADKKDFNFLIRAAKWQDQNGDLDAAIALLEQAKAKAESSKNKAQLTWIYSNMGDFYGHAGRLDDSKASFQKALALDSADWYSFKGLAYMAWSADKDAKKALSMLEKASVYSADPSLRLLKADITEHNGNPADASIMRANVYDHVSVKDYGNMYNSFMVHHNLDNNDLEKAESIALAELQVRKTPSSYALMAATKYKQEKVDEALELTVQNVIGHTYEPKILLEVLPIAARVESLKKDILLEVGDASYELGPLAYHKLEAY